MIAAKHLRFCIERGRLLDLTTAATSSYSDAVRELTESIGKVSKEQYRRKKSEVEILRVDVSHAREALDTHRALHGC